MPPRTFPLEVTVSPRFDLFYALHALASETATALQGWKEKARRRLPAGFAREAKRVAPLPIFWPLLADAVQHVPGGISFDEILTALNRMPAADLKTNILTGILHDGTQVEALLSRKKSLRQLLADDDLAGGELLSHFGLRPYDQRSEATAALTRLLSDAASFREELAAVLRIFWGSGFQDDWSLLERRLRVDGASMETRRNSSAPSALASGLRLPVEFDEAAGEMRTKSGGVVAFDRIERCYLLPSAFNTRRWWARYDAGERATIYFPVWVGPDAINSLRLDDVGTEKSMPQSRRSRAARISAAEIFRALGDTTRYAIASIIARNPTSSADLSRSLRVSKPTITHHVQLLREAGLIDEQSDGASSRLSLNRDTLAALSDAAVGQLFSSTGELQLLTTRKRRGGRKSA